MELSERKLAYLCSTGIVITALAFGHDGQLALWAIVGMLGLDKVADYLKKKKESNG